VRSISKFLFVTVPTAALATAAVVGVSRAGHRTAATSDGDLQRDLQLASSTALELAPVAHPLTTVSAIEESPSAAPERSVRPKRNRSGQRAIRSHAHEVRAAPEPEVAESTAESEASETSALAGAASEATTVTPAEGGVALPRPTAVPVSFPTGGGGEGTYDPGPGSVIRGGVLDGDHCQIHGRGGSPVYGPPIYRPRGISIGDRIRGAMMGVETPRGSIGDRVRAAHDRAGSSTSSSRRGSVADRIRAARGR
jgi:hypothetical protein